MPRRRTQTAEQTVENTENTVNVTDNTVEAETAAQPAQEETIADAAGETAHDTAEEVNVAAEGQDHQPSFTAVIRGRSYESGVFATADVKVGDLLTIRNVKIEQDDYGLTVTMPRTKMSGDNGYKDSVYFADKGMKERFDQAVVQACHEYFRMGEETVHTAQEEQGEDDGMEEESGMNMGM